MSGRIAASLLFVVVGLAGRSLIDRLLADAGGPVAVAGWAQIASVVELVAGVSLTGVGLALTVLSAGRAQSERLHWLKPALCVSLSLSLAVAGLAWMAQKISGVTPLPGAPELTLPALLAGWLAVSPGLLVALLLGLGRQGQATAVSGLGFVLPFAALVFVEGLAPWWRLLAGQTAFSVLATLAALRLARGQPPLSGTSLRTLLRFVPAGLAIGIMSPLGLAWARAEIAGSLSWHAIGQVQALWRASDWITAIMAGLLNACFLPRLGAAAGPAFLAELRRAAAATLLPAALALGGLFLLLPQVLALLYGNELGVARSDALFFLFGDGLRVVSWIALFGLFARRAAWAITLGEFLSLPLFALLLHLFAGSYDLREIGLCWLASYAAYALFNFLALRRCLVGETVRGI